MSADPLAVHVPGEADWNLYAYVNGAVLKAVDPIGLTIEDVLARRSVDTVIDRLRSLGGPAKVVSYARNTSTIMAYRFRQGFENTVRGWFGRSEAEAKYQPDTDELQLKHHKLLALVRQLPDGSDTRSRGQMGASGTLEALVHESTHAYLMKGPTKEVRDFVSKGISYYESKGYGWTSERVFHEAAAGYAGHRAGAWGEAMGTLRSLGLWDGIMDENFVKYATRKVDDARKTYNAAMKERVFGYDHFGNDATHEISAPMKRFLDKDVLEGRVGDDFDQTFKKELEAVQAKIDQAKSESNE